MTNHPRKNWMNHCNNRWLRPTLSSMATARKAKKPIIHFRCERSKEICVCFVLLLVTPTDLSTHAVTHFGSRPFTSFVQSFDTWYSDKRLADRFTGFRVNTSHQGQSILKSSILAYWTLSGIGTKSTSTTTKYQFPFGIGPGSGPHPHRRLDKESISDPSPIQSSGCDHCLGCQDTKESFLVGVIDCWEGFRCLLMRHAGRGHPTTDDVSQSSIVASFKRNGIACLSGFQAGTKDQPAAHGQSPPPPGIEGVLIQPPGTNQEEDKRNHHIPKAPAAKKKEYVHEDPWVHTQRCITRKGLEFAAADAASAEFQNRLGRKREGRGRKLLEGEFPMRPNVRGMDREDIPFQKFGQDVGRWH